MWMTETVRKSEVSPAIIKYTWLCQMDRREGEGKRTRRRVYIWGTKEGMGGGGGGGGGCLTEV